ncbi:MAG: DUF362 domain-containing protein [Chloroflexota bacterium]|nr:DUF362 domain-containing protein [Chloroflexota bacterium]
MIFIEKTQDREGFTSRILAASMESRIQEINRVLIKPNIVSQEPYPTTTHPDVLRTVIQYFLSHNKEVLVTDSPAFDAGFSSAIIENHPLKLICDSFGVPLTDLSQCAKRNVEIDGVILEIFCAPLEYDQLISLPVLKSHIVCEITGALKNQFAFFTMEERIDMHIGHNDLHKSIAGINTIIKPHFYIVDAVETLTRANEVRHGGKPKHLGFMLAGTDPVAIDTAGLKLLQKVEPNLAGKSCMNIPYLRYAIDFGLGNEY